MHATEFDEAQLPGIAAGRQATARGQLRWLDGLMVEAGRPDFICGTEIMLADIQVRKLPSRPEVGPTAAFSGCVPTSMHKPTCIS